MIWGGMFKVIWGGCDLGLGFGLEEAGPALLIVGEGSILTRGSVLALVRGSDRGWGREGVMGCCEMGVVVVGRVFDFGSGLIDWVDGRELFGGVVRAWLAASSAGVV